MASESLIVELDAKTQKLDAKLKATDERLEGLERQTKKNDLAFAKLGAAAVTAMTAAAAATIAAARAAGQFSKELEVASTRFGTTVEGMQSLAFASNTVGISLEKLGDIGKDVNEKLGEFVATGGGGFQDFVDVMGIGTTEARQLALEFQNLSADQVMGRMVERMESAGVSGQQMSFALEGLASDATDLLPLLQDNSKELNRLRGEFDSLNVSLTEDQIKRLKEVNVALDKMSSTLSTSSAGLIADYSDEIIIAIETITNLGIKTLNAFNVIAVGWGNLVEISKAAISDLIDGTDTLAEVMEDRAKISSEALLKLEEGASKPLEIMVKKRVDAGKEETKQDEKNKLGQLKNTRNYVSAMSSINDAFLNENKEVKAALVIADTAAAVMLQLSSGDPYTAFGRAAVAAATGAAQLQAVLSASRGGGSTASVSGGGIASSGGQSAPQEETPQQSVIVTDVSGDSADSIVLKLDDGTDLATGLLERQNDLRGDGRGDLF